MRIIRWFLLLANLLVPLVWGLSGFSLWGAAAMFIVHMLSLWATFWPSCQWWGEVTCEFETDAPELWLTIDDGPDGEHTRVVMDVLEKSHACATFFFIGKRCHNDPGLLAEVERRGHGIGNHTQNHPAYMFWLMGPRRVSRELSECSLTIEQLAGSRPTLFRAPAGIRNCFVHPVLSRMKMNLLGWSARGLDGSCNDVDKIVARIEKRVKPGAIIVLHEGRRTDEGEPLIMKTLPRVLKIIESRGLKAVIPELL
ncbi:MAG: polysaccharide deacetylase family protein [Verrucomicrobiaceae bacterium]|nr:polysaccharide deacetylase family protein [Verrucomicrobiaceae bacterium]